MKKTTYQAINELGITLLNKTDHVIFVDDAFFVSDMGHQRQHRVCTGAEYNALVEKLSHGKCATQFALYEIHSKELLSVANSIPQNPKTLPIIIEGSTFHIEDRNLVMGVRKLHESIEKLKAERVELRKVSEAHKHNTALVATVGEYCRENSVGDWGGSAVESLIKSHSDQAEQGTTDHERHMCEMLLRMMRGQPVECRAEPENLPHIEWHDATGLSLNTEREYRIPVKKLNIPWEHIKPEYKFAAMGSDGVVFVFASAPVLKSVVWNIGPDVALSIIGALTIDTDGIDWKESLTERPA
jgi:hypothetical protein